MTCNKDCENCMYSEKILIHVKCKGSLTCNGDCKNCYNKSETLYKYVCKYRGL